MKQKCHECKAPLTSYKCNYCGAENKKIKGQSFTSGEASDTATSEGQVNQQDRSSRNDVSRPKQKKKIPILSGVVVVMAIVAAVFYLYHPLFGSNTIYVCHNAPTLSTNISDVTTITTIESRGDTMIRWIEQDVFPRQAYIDRYWGVGLEVSDDDIRAWFEGSYNTTGTEGIYLELVAVDDDFIIINTILDYENMSEADLDQLWDPDFSSVTRDDAINYLENQGAFCVRQ